MNEVQYSTLAVAVATHTAVGAVAAQLGALMW
jgi:hypothetical protein